MTETHSYRILVAVAIISTHSCKPHQHHLCALAARPVANCGRSIYFIYETISFIARNDYLWVFHNFNTAYLKIVHYEFDYQELVDFVSTIFPTKLFKQEHEYASSAMARGLAQLLYCYSQGIASTGYPKPLFKPTQSGEKATLTVSISYANVEYITNAVEWYKRSYYSFSNWGYLINSINLLSRLVD